MQQVPLPETPTIACLFLYPAFLNRIIIVFGLLAALAGGASALYGQQIEVPAGWQVKQKADTFLLRPDDAGNRLLTYSIFPITNLHGQSIYEWAEVSIMKDIASVGSTNDNFRMKSSASQLYSAIFTGRDKAGKPLAFTYIIYEGSGKEARIARVLSDPDKNFYAPYLKTIARHFMTTVQWKNNGSNAAGSTARNTDDRRSERTRNSSSGRQPSVDLKNIIAAPGRGLGSAEVDGIYINAETSFGVGGIPIQTYEPYLLLKDKSIYRRLQLPPQLLDVKRSKELEPNQWGSWTQEGKNIIVTWNNGRKETWNSWHKTLPAETDTRLEGHYTSIGGGGNAAMGGSVTVFYSNDITFFKDGRYIQGKTSGGTNSGDNGTVTTRSSGKSGGTYQVSGNKISFRDNEGQISEQAFYFFPDKQRARSNTAIGIGSSVFTRK